MESIFEPGLSECPSCCSNRAPRFTRGGLARTCTFDENLCSRLRHSACAMNVATSHVSNPLNRGVFSEPDPHPRFEDPTKTVVEHVSFVMCYVFANVEPRDLPNGRLLRIVDMSRMDTRDTSYEAFMFLKAMASMVSVAFPERVHRVVIVNPPIVFGLIWSVFSPMASQATLARVRICQTTEEARQTLSEDLDLCDIPREYGGECDCGNNKRGSRSGGGTRKRFSVEGRGRRGRTPMHCPIAQCSDCWRHSELEQDLWDRISELNGGLVGIDAQKQTGAKGSTRGRPRSSRRPKKQGEGTFGLVKGEEGEDCDGSSKRRTRSVMSDSEVSELSDSAQSWFW